MKIDYRLDLLTTAYVVVIVIVGAGVIAVRDYSVLSLVLTPSRLLLD